MWNVTQQPQTDKMLHYPEVNVSLFGLTEEKLNKNQKIQGRFELRSRNIGKKYLKHWMESSDKQSR